MLVVRRTQASRVGVWRRKLAEGWQIPPPRSVVMLGEGRPTLHSPPLDAKLLQALRRRLGLETHQEVRVYTDEEKAKMTPEEHKKLSLSYMTSALPESEIENFETNVQRLRDSRLLTRTFWQDFGLRFPNLCQLARAVLCIPGSSAESERAFSIMGRVISKFRAASLPTTSQARFMVAKNVPVDRSEFSSFINTELKAHGLKKKEENKGKPPIIIDE